MRLHPLPKTKKEATEGRDETGPTFLNYEIVITFRISISYLAFPYQCWEHYATGQKAAGSIPDEIIEPFN
jgi:hypothetical protein